MEFVLAVATILSAVATALAGHPTNVYCHLPPDKTSWCVAQECVEGWAYDYPAPHTDKIYLRHCGAVVALQRYAGTVYAHEILHIVHPIWKHPKINRISDWYWWNVVRPRLRAKLH